MVVVVMLVVVVEMEVEVVAVHIATIEGTKGLVCTKTL